MRLMKELVFDLCSHQEAWEMQMMHVSSSSCFPGEHGSYFCSSLKALEIEGIWHLRSY